MRLSRTAVLLASGVLVSIPAAPAYGEPPAQSGNCVSYFTTGLAEARAAGGVISFGAKDLAPFGKNSVSRQAHAQLGACVFDPGDFLP